MMMAITTLVYLSVPIVGSLGLARMCLTNAARAEYWSRLAAIAFILPVLAFLLPSLVLLHLAMFLVVPLTVRRNAPGDAAAIYMFAMLMLPSLGTYLQIGGSLLWFQDIDQTLGIGALLTLLAQGRPPRGSLASHAPFLCIFATAVLASARDTSFTNLAREVFQTFLVYGLPYLIVIRSISTQEDIRRIMLALAVGGGVISAIFIVEAILSWPFYRQVYTHFGLDVSTVGVHLRAGAVRASGPFMEPISGAMVLVFCFFALWLSKDRFKSAIHYWLFVALLGLGLIAPQSRSAWIGALIGFLLIDLFRKRYGAFWRNLTILTFAGAAILPAAVVDHRVAEMVGLGGDSVGTVDYRQQLFDRGIEEVAKHPLIGQSRAQVNRSLADLQTGENIVDFVNTYLYWALVLGVPGALIFAGALLASVFKAWRLRVRDSGPAAAFLVASLAAQIVMIAFTFFSGRAAIMVVGLIGILAVFPRQRKPSTGTRLPDRNVPRLAGEKPVIELLDSGQMEGAVPRSF